MKDYVQLYIEFLLMIDPKIYLSEIRDYRERDLGLNGTDLPSIMTIQRFIAQRGFTRKKCTKTRGKSFLSMRQGLKILPGVMVGHLQTTHFHPLHPK